MAASYSPPQQFITSPKNLRGSLGWGVAAFYLTLTLGYIFCIGLSQMLRGYLSDNGLLLAYGLGAWMFPLLGGIVHAAKGKTRTALGMLLGFATLLGLAVLLIAGIWGFSALIAS